MTGKPDVMRAGSRAQGALNPFQKARFPDTLVHASKRTRSHSSYVSASVYQFGDLRLDCGAFELLRDGHSLRVERKPMELLILLASRPGQLVTRTEIAERLWSSEVFVDTEHGINTAVRKLRYLLRDDPENPQFIQTVTGMGYRFIAPVATVEPEPPAFMPTSGVQQESRSECYPDQAGSEASVAPASVAATGRHRHLWIAVAAVAILIAVLVPFVGHHPLATRLLHRNSVSPINSLAVLPLDNLSGDPNQEYFADGMTDELITMLAKDSTLRITSRTSVMQFKGARRPLREIAHDLDVDGILEGSVARSGGQVHMTLQLIRADTDTHLWAESYDRGNNDAPLLPDQAARQITGYLHKASSVAATGRSVNPDAHDAYLRGRFLFFANRFEEAETHFQKAADLQSDYAPAWAGLAQCYGASTMDGRHDPRIAYPRADAPATRALALDPTLPEAHMAMAGLLFLGHWDWIHADQEVLRAIELDPHQAEPYHLRARILTAVGRGQEAIAVQKKQMELDPFARPWGMAQTYYNVRQYDAAISDARLRLENSPNDVRLLYFIARSLFDEGRYKEATDAWASLYRAVNAPQAAAEAEDAYQAGGYRALVRWQLRSEQKEAKAHYLSPVDLAYLHAELGQRDQTLALLEEGFQHHSPQILWIQTEKAYDFLHADPRYQSLIHRIGLPPAN
jgi:TolB-like protein/DNA-binding winged helix-turn-helix (wHTH) protein/cytochrome c-type biogenesis protein CcmH/NrfG